MNKCYNRLTENKNPTIPITYRTQIFCILQPTDCIMQTYFTFLLYEFRKTIFQALKHFDSLCAYKPLSNSLDKVMVNAVAEYCEKITNFY